MAHPPQSPGRSPAPARSGPVARVRTAPGGAGDGPALVAVRLPAGAFLAELERLWAVGDAVLPLPVNVPDSALEPVLTSLRPAAVIDGGGEHRRSGGVGVRPGTALVIPTSGSTGRPKGVELSFAALEASTDASLRRLGAVPSDRWLCCLPVAHIAGLQVLLRARRLGSPPLVHEGFDPQAIAGEVAATHVSLVPTMLARLLDLGVDVARFRRILLGGAPAMPGLLERARRVGARVTTTYGMTETCGGCVYDGAPLDGVAVAIEPDGRIAINGPVLFDGYRLDPDATRRVRSDGWFTTDDAGAWSDDGSLTVVGRLDDMIITGGENVPAARVAELLAAHPAVADAAVVGRPDPRWGQRVVAVIVARAGAPIPTLDQLRRHVRRNAPAAYAPRELLVTDKIPRTALGKLARDRLSG